MKLQMQIKTTAALALSALAVAGPAVAGSGLNGYRDAHERGAAATSGEAAIAYFVANERSTLTQPSGEAAIKYFRENERSTLSQPSGEAVIKYFHDNELRGPRRASLPQSTTTGALAGYVDGPERGQPVQAISPITQISGDDNSGFDWEAAIVGASSALMLALLIGVGLLTARRFRGGQVAH
jgi:hypothetical protein